VARKLLNIKKKLLDILAKKEERNRKDDEKLNVCIIFMNYNTLRVYSATRSAHVCVARQTCVHRIVRYASPRADRLLYRDTHY
jgi:hypothetical protein